MTIAEAIFYSVIVICSLPVVLFLLILLTVVAYVAWMWVLSKID